MGEPETKDEAVPAWRAPTTGEHVCAGCGAAAHFGWGASWFCRACTPADFFPHQRSPRP